MKTHANKHSGSPSASLWVYVSSKALIFGGKNSTIFASDVDMIQIF